MNNNYDYIFKWLKNATKEERHINEMESFAKKHPIIFMKFHTLSKRIVDFEENNKEYLVSCSAQDKNFTSKVAFTRSFNFLFIHFHIFHK